MEAETKELFRCCDCNKVFAKGMDYNRHRKRHDKLYACSLCEKRFGLKTDLDRHRQTHRIRESARNFRCNFPRCKFRGTSRKDYLWKHLQEKHQDCQRNPFEKTLREHYEEFAREGLTLQAELDLELLEAARTGDIEQVSNLLSREANISTKDSLWQTPLDLAVFSGHRAVVKLLCDHGADINSVIYNAVNPFKEAAWEILIENGVDINCQDLGRNQSTALYYAADFEDERMARFLLEKGADVNTQGAFRKKTALHVAVIKSEAVTRVLLEANPDINAKDMYGKTPLFYASGYKRDSSQATAKLLLDAGATVERCDWVIFPKWFREQNAKFAPTHVLH